MRCLRGQVLIWLCVTKIVRVGTSCPDIGVEFITDESPSNSKGFLANPDPTLHKQHYAVLATLDGSTL